MSNAMKLQYLMTDVRDSFKIQIALPDPKSSEVFLTYARKVQDTIKLAKINYSNDHQSFEQPYK